MSCVYKQRDIVLFNGLLTLISSITARWPSAVSLNVVENGGINLSHVWSSSNPPNTFPERKVLSSLTKRSLNCLFEWSNLVPPIMAHKILIIDTLKVLITDTVPLGLEFWSCCNSLRQSRISSWIRASILVLPNQNSRSWRRVKRRCSFHNSPFPKNMPVIFFVVVRKKIEICSWIC